MKQLNWIFLSSPLLPVNVCVCDSVQGGLEHASDAMHARIPEYADQQCPHGPDGES